MIFCYSLEIDSIVNGNKVDLGELGNESAPKLEQGTADVMGLFIPLLVYINNIKYNECCLLGVHFVLQKEHYMGYHKFAIIGTILGIIVGYSMGFT